MKVGSFLVDATRGEKRFQIDSLLAEGKSYQIALARDTAMENKLVCVKTIAYDPRRLDDKKYVGQRRKVLHNELKVLAEPFHLVPDPLDWIQLPESETALGREPVLVYEYVHGDTLYDVVREKYPEGMNPARAVRIAAELAEFLAGLHQKGFIFRDLDPRHVVVSLDDIIHVIGCSNIVTMGERLSQEQLETNHAYTAPEIRGDLSGKMLRPAADAYALGALLSFLVTGEEPRASTENPLTREAYQKLAALEPKGVSLLVARCMRPMAKERVARMERLMPLLDIDNLPSPSTKGFGLTALPAPWQGAEPDNRATRSNLSSGPLISVQNESGSQIAEPAKEGALQKKTTRGCRAYFPFLLVLLMAASGVVSLIVL